MFATAGKAGDRAAHAANSRKFLATIRTAIDKAGGECSSGERKIVTALLIGDSQIDTSLLPFNAVR
jgi:hypothetical protein